MDASLLVTTQRTETKEVIIVYMKQQTKTKVRWTAEERQAFADGNRLKAQTIRNKKREAARKACRRGDWQ